MVVRIRLKKDPLLGGLFAGLASALTLVAVACFILGAWKIFSELGWIAVVFLRSGTFSHWQVWVAFGVIAQLVSFRLNRLHNRSRFSSL
jgi:hypothetical protein